MRGTRIDVERRQCGLVNIAGPHCLARRVPSRVVVEDEAEAMNLYDVWVRCHACTKLFEVNVDVGFVNDDIYTIPAGERMTCAHCGRVHTAGVEMRLA